MGIQVALNHRTRYRYERAVTLGPQTVRLRPASHCRTPILGYSLRVTPARHIVNWQQDAYGNHLARLIFDEKTPEFVIEVGLLAELSAINPFDFLLEPEVEEYPFEYDAELARDLQIYRTTAAPGPLLDAFLRSVSREKRRTIGFLVDLNRRLKDDIGYVHRLDPGIQSCEQTLEQRTGSCRDSSWLLVQLLRHAGFAARFVSGYLIQLAVDGAQGDGQDGASTDSAELHAWAEVFLPGAGWIGLDPTSGLLTGPGHIPLACTPDSLNAAPILGTVEPVHVDFGYSMSVRRLNQSPRLTNPFTDEQWARVEEVAKKVDADLVAWDVRLTMGGEPTFVGIDEPDSPQWNGAALGPLKRTRAVSLIKSLRRELAPFGLLHFGQGKWYPGEPLPRWAMSCYWRADGVPVWENADLIAEEDREYGFVTCDALQFMEALARRLQVSASGVLAAYAIDSTEPAGYILPIRRRQHGARLYWSSQLWFVPPERLVLLPGDSPIGYRLSVESVPWVVADQINYEMDAEPFADREKLPLRPARHPDWFDASPPEDWQPAVPATDESGREKIRPALCVQVREGRLHVFLPYTPKLPDYLDLVAAVEDTCAHLQKPVWIEGYTPPADPRLRSFSITPDPGVIEVNLPPARGWDELEHINHLVFEHARQNRLTAEKFAYDGKHMPTGGGNHIVIGGPTVADSPLLRRPDVLRSMVAFWQNHPSLSYLFSGTFIGPTSQYPRIDEARMDALYELEIAFRQVPSGECPPWLVDRLFRNLLVDMTGNTHRAEFCIDKLYPPEGSGAQLGLLELRAFEMAPHVRMSLAELLLIRALVAMFWKRPYDSRLIRWGTALHDRFLLPHFVKEDFLDVLHLLHRFGYDFDERWFASHFEFRFPKIGSIAAGGLRLELRQALEPWHVLGEEAASGATVRGVDSSLERLQVKVSGFTESRYLVACNGRRVPVHPTGESGEAVAGVRFRAWQFPTCLHPTIPVHSPLTFEIFDLWNEQSIGKCAYHVMHPAGDRYSARPANASEADIRRQERFQLLSDEPTDMTAPAPDEETNPVFPMTLDLRWPAPGQFNRVPCAAPVP